jgi:hypothetical protein
MQNIIPWAPKYVQSSTHLQLKFSWTQESSSAFCFKYFKFIDNNEIHRRVQRQWEANSRSAGQEIPLILRNPKAFFYRNHKIPPLDPILSQLNPTHTQTLFI